MDVKTRVLKVNIKLLERKKIKIAARVLRKKGIIAYPTDTFYGLGADCFSPQAVKKVYALKRRETRKPISIVIPDVKEVRKVAVDIPPFFRVITDRFWPGPLTIVLRASPAIPGELCGEERKVGVRVPALEWLRQLLREAGFPITATSANISGQEVCTTAEEIAAVLKGKIELIIDAGRISHTAPSTVIDLTSEKPRILREGAISSAALKDLLML
ncbi:MAG: L-threonylcarbamoyladenylate synthase [Candidatus Aminicenantales bacterium]